MFYPKFLALVSVVNCVRFVISYLVKGNNCEG